MGKKRKEDGGGGERGKARVNDDTPDRADDAEDMRAPVFSGVSMPTQSLLTSLHLHAQDEGGQASEREARKLPLPPVMPLKCENQAGYHGMGKGRNGPKGRVWQARWSTHSSHS